VANLDFVFAPQRCIGMLAAARICLAPHGGTGHAMAA
jgi:hypothetical protein